MTPRPSSPPASSRRQADCPPGTQTSLNAFRAQTSHIETLGLQGRFSSAAAFPQITCSFAVAFSGTNYPNQTDLLESQSEQ